MAKSRLITTSLIGSINWYQNSPPSWKQKAYDDLSNTLNRIWTGTNEAAQRGIDFENKVYEIATEGRADLGSKAFQIVVSKCAGGSFQDKLKAYEVIDGETYCLYGKSDVMFKNLLIDIKTTKEFKESKYSGSFQHILYMYLTGIQFFDYVIAEWDVYPRIKQVHEITITFDNPKIELHEEVVNTVRKAMEFLQSRPILWKAYLEKFCR